MCAYSPAHENHLAMLMNNAGKIQSQEDILNDRQSNYHLRVDFQVISERVKSKPIIGSAIEEIITEEKILGQMKLSRLHIQVNFSFRRRFIISMKISIKRNHTMMTQNMYRIFLKVSESLKVLLKMQKIWTNPYLRLRKVPSSIH